MIEPRLIKGNTNLRGFVKYDLKRAARDERQSRERGDERRYRDVRKSFKFVSIKQSGECVPYLSLVKSNHQSLQGPVHTPRLSLHVFLHPGA